MKRVDADFKQPPISTGVKIVISAAVFWTVTFLGILCMWVGGAKIGNQNTGFGLLMVLVVAAMITAFIHDLYLREG